MLNSRLEFGSNNLIVNDTSELEIRDSQSSQSSGREDKLVLSCTFSSRYPEYRLR